MTEAPRRLRLRVFSCAALFACAGFVGLAAQPPKEQEDPKSTVKKKVVIEDEDPKGTVKKKIVVDDDPVVGKKANDVPAGSAPDVKLDELVKAAEETRNSDYKRIFTRYSIPFDRLVEAGGGISIKPIPYRKSEWPAGLEAVSIVPLDANGKPREARAAHVKDVRSVDHFESLVQAEVDTLLKQKSEGAALLEHLTVSEKLLGAALRFHEYAREHSYPDRKGSIRSGKTWDDIRSPLVAKLRDVRLELLRTALAANDAPRVREVGTRLMNAYPKDAVVAQAVAVARIGEADRLIQSANHLDHVRAKELLDEFEARFPGAGGDAVRKLRKQLSDIAQKAFTRAREKKAVGDLTTARDELARAAALDPTIEGVREMQRELRTGYPILYVGVRQFPMNLSPATARLDSEKQAVELVFEGLLEEVPEESGAVRYRPGAAVAMPLAVPGGRDFILRTFERDASGRPGFDSQDVVGTLSDKVLGAQTHSWAGYPLAWLQPPVPKDANSIRIPFGGGHSDPRGALDLQGSTRAVPHREWQGSGRRGVRREAVRHRAVQVPGRTNPDPSVPRELIFVDNPTYGRWRDRTGLPSLREIRMIEVAKLDPVAAFREDKLHILTDVPTTELEKFTAPGSGLVGKVQVVTATSNRRVHILAVNLNRPYLQGKAIRQGLSLAIDRDEILREVFRAGKPEFHKPMTGPFPPGSWAGPKATAATPLVNRDLAVSRLKAYLADAGAKTDFSLAYPEDDPRAAAACAKIKTHIEGLLKDAPAKARHQSRSRSAPRTDGPRAGRAPV